MLFDEEGILDDLESEVKTKGLAHFSISCTLRSIKAWRTYHEELGEDFDDGFTHVRPIFFLQSRDCKIKSRSLLASPTSRVTDVWGYTIMEVSTILDGRAVIVEGPAKVGLEGCIPVTMGDMGRV